MEEGSGSGSGCERCRTWEEEIYWKHFNSMHFYLILPKDFHDHLVLPGKFAENMIAKLPNKLSLLGPSGTVWNIELLKTNTIMFVGDGWKEFVKTYDLRENNLLMFHFKMNWSFEVLIFDQETLCEKEATYFVKKCTHSKPDDKIQKNRTTKEASSTKVMEDEDKDNDESEDYDEDDGKDDDYDDSELIVTKKSRKDVEEPVSSGGRNNNQRIPRKCVLNAANRGKGRPRKIVSPLKPPSKEKLQSEKEPTGNGTTKEQSHISGREQLTPEVRGSTPEAETAHFDKSSETVGGSPEEQVPPDSSSKIVLASKEYRSKRRPVTEIEKENALQKALQETTENSFISVMRPTSVYNSFYLSIPAEWMKKYLPRRQQEVVLRVGEKTWHTMFDYKSRNQGGLSPGWKKFALENFLEEFDVCLFKLASQQDDLSTVLDVVIFRVIQKIVPSSPISS